MKFKLKKSNSEVIKFTNVLFYYLVMDLNEIIIFVISALFSNARSVRYSFYSRRHCVDAVMSSLIFLNGNIVNLIHHFKCPLSIPSY